MSITKRDQIWAVTHSQDSSGIGTKEGSRAQTIKIFCA